MRCAWTFKQLNGNVNKRSGEERPVEYLARKNIQEISNTSSFEKYYDVVLSC